VASTGQKRQQWQQLTAVAAFARSSSNGQICINLQGQKRQQRQLFTAWWQQLTAVAAVDSSDSI
jgi:hypothetical protein